MTDNGACFRCGESTDFHIYKSERGENKTYHCCEKCEDELRK